MTPRLPRAVREAIQDFQRYVQERHSRRYEDWPHAEPLIVRIAQAMRAAGLGPQEIARGLRVEFEFAERPGAVHGTMLPTADGFKAVIHDPPDGEEARFTMMHECGHTLLHSLEGRPAQIVPGGIGLSGTPLGRRQEDLCDAFARAVLDGTP